MGFASILLVVAATISLASATDYCTTSYGVGYYCSYRCCDYSSSLDYTCCISLGGAYWYAWVLITTLFLLCVCGCIGCCGYGYRRQYLVRRTVHHPAHMVQPVVVTSHTSNSSQGYQPLNNQYKGYQPPPPPYDPNYTY